MIAYTSEYYGVTPLEVEQWKTSQLHEWYEAATDLEKEKARAYKKAIKNGQES